MPVTMEQVKVKLGDLKEQLCDHAVHGCGPLNLPSPRDRALAAMMVLMASAAEVATAAGLYTTFVAWCATQVPGQGMDEKGRIIW